MDHGTNVCSVRSVCDGRDVDTRTRGDLAEAAILHALMRDGFLVLVPFGRFGPYDLLAETPGGEFLRVQVKSGRLRAGSVEFNCCGTDHGRGVGSYVGRADAFAVHVHESGDQFVVPVPEARASKMYLRITAPANGQRSGVRSAADYRLEDWAARVTGGAATPASASAASA